MGATDFTAVGSGSTVSQAFDNAVASALWEHGHRGYTGTIAEKDSFVVIKDTPEQVLQKMEGSDKERYAKLFASRSPDVQISYVADALLELYDERISNKWGPAGAIHVKDDTWLFFGFAST